MTNNPDSFFDDLKGMIESKRYKKATQRITNASVPAQVEYQIKTKYHLYLAIQEDTVFVPGVLWGETYSKKNIMTFILPGTSDAIQSSEHREWIESAKRFAAAYNAELESKLGPPENR